MAPAALSAPFGGAEVPRAAGAAPRSAAGAEGQRSAVMGGLGSLPPWVSLWTFQKGLFALSLLAASETMRSRRVLVAFPVLMGPPKAEGPLRAPAALSALRDSGPGSHAAILWRSSAAPVVSHTMGVSPIFFSFKKNRFDF